MSFQEIVGQEAAVGLLKAAWRSGRLAHAYLFVGPAGIGKKEAAVNFAKLLVCASPRGEEPCDACAACVKSAAGNHPDVRWIVPDGPFIKIDAVREACIRLSLKGFESSRKVLIVEDAHRFNEESANALLKTLEEPSSHTVVILLSETQEALLPTIVSRCQRVAFSPLKAPVLQGLLRERFRVGPQEAVYLTRLCEGSLGRALERHRAQLFGHKNKMIDETLDPSASGKGVFSGSSQDDEAEDARAEAVFTVLASWFRDLLVAKATGSAERAVNSDRGADILAQARRYSIQELEDRLAAVAEAAAQSRRPANKKILWAYLRAQLWK